MQAGEQSGAASGPIRRVLSSVADLLATLLSIGRTRLELLTVEVQLEIRRIAEIAIWLLIALQAAVLSVIAAAFWLVLLFWDSHRLLVAGLVALAFFAIATTAITVATRKWHSKPHLLAATLNELSQDAERLRAQQ